MFMQSSNMSVAKGIGIGLAVGTAAAVAGSKLMSGTSKRARKRAMTKCIKTAENVVDGISSMMK